MIINFFVVFTLVICVISADLPVITKDPVNVTTTLGSNVSFLCEASGNPAPVIVMVKKENELYYNFPEPGSGGDTAEVSVQKILKKIVRQSEGWYVCIATNSHGHVTSDAYLEILSDPCDGVKCPNSKSCHANYTSMEAECRCKICEDNQFRPVCGSDCKPYFNTCHLRLHSCANKLGLIILQKGECRVEEAKLTVSALNSKIYEGEKLSLKCDSSGYPAPIAFRWAKVMKNGKQKIIGSGEGYSVPAAHNKDAGNYRCFAQQCRKRVKSGEEIVEVLDKGLDNPVPKLNIGGVFGASHVHTFDGSNYNFMGRCNYILALDCFMNKWMVLGQFTPCGDGVSCLEQLTLYHGSMRPLTLTRGWIVAQDGEKFRLRKRKPTVIGEATVTYTGLSVEVQFPGGVQLIYDGLWGVQITVDDKEVTCGLCGDNNGDMTDDLMTGRFGHTGNDTATFGQSWAMWNSAWCTKDDSRNNGTCENEEEIEDRCDSILQSQGFNKCTAALGYESFRESCITAGCKTMVARFEGSSVCAVAHSLAQLCQINGFGILKDFLKSLDCGTKREFQKNVYNAGCPLEGNPPYLEP